MEHQNNINRNLSLRRFYFSDEGIPEPSKGAPFWVLIIFIKITSTGLRPIGFSPWIPNLMMHIQCWKAVPPIRFGFDCEISNCIIVIWLHPIFKWVIYMSHVKDTRWVMKILTGKSIFDSSKRFRFISIGFNIVTHSFIGLVPCSLTFIFDPWWSESVTICRTAT